MKYRIEKMSKSFKKFQFNGKNYQLLGRVWNDITFHYLAMNTDAGRVVEFESLHEVQWTK